jgi:membrane protease YdiL (CAAX protease family)
VIAPLFPDNAGVGLIVLLPFLAALIAAGLLDGRAGLRELWQRILIWRVGWRWYAAALIIPTIIHLIVAGIAGILGESITIPFDVLLLTLLATLILATFEEIGWTAYAVPRFLEKWSARWVMLVFGIVHAAFHLPMYLLPLPEELRQSVAFPFFTIMVVAFSVFRIWLYENTQGSVLISIVYHFAINASVILITGTSRETQAWLLPTAWSIAVLVFYLAYYRPTINRTKKFQT